MRHLTTVTLAAALLSGVITGCAMPYLDTPPGESSLMSVAAQGVQVYECRAAPGATPAWAFIAPEAELFDGNGRRIGRHGAGPVWQHEDGSGFVGTVRSRVDAPRPGAIPWLLLSARPQGASGVFSPVTSVKRINTVGGQAPADGCSAGTLGQRVHMAYRADYVLFSPQR